MPPPTASGPTSDGRPLAMLAPCMRVGPTTLASSQYAIKLHAAQNEQRAPVKWDHACKFMQVQVDRRFGANIPAYYGVHISIAPRRSSSKAARTRRAVDNACKIGPALCLVRRLPPRTLFVNLLLSSIVL